MTALPLRDFTDAEKARLAAIEAAPAAEESLRERVARAMCDADGDGIPWEDWPEHVHAAYRRYADAAIDVLRGPSSDAEQAIERVRDVVAFVDACAVGIAPTRAAAYEDISRRLRRALDGLP